MLQRSLLFSYQIVTEQLFPMLFGNFLCCVNAPFVLICNFILYFVSLLLTSPYFCSLLEYSAHFRSLQFTSSFWPNLSKNVSVYSSNVTFYWCAMSDLRMFIVLILTWSIRNTSVNRNLLVCRVATIHKIFLHFQNVEPTWLKVHAIGHIFIVANGQILKTYWAIRSHFSLDMATYVHL